eukprot:TRINITY_DN38778_c0_g1_i3.p1 TRINITY_DN38778_c0_g1~~TRINITY_DN38778_c0_g1_i3.p1  ORF type:complete len:1574 (+),score=251.11 TRINITY_DN38778_c0_g1_i3:119-4840(+)
MSTPQGQTPRGGQRSVSLPPIADNSRPVSARAPSSGRRVPSGVVPKQEKVAPRAPVPLRALVLDDQDLAAVEAQLARACSPSGSEAEAGEAVGNAAVRTAWAEPAAAEAPPESSDRRAASPPVNDACRSTVLLDTGYASPAELPQQYRLQYQLEEPGQEASAVWQDVPVAHRVELRGKPFLAIRLPTNRPAMAKLRMTQRQLPNNLASWTEWQRNGRKDMDAWLTRSMLPLLVGLERPASPTAHIEVDSSGLSYELKVVWSAPPTSMDLLKTTLHWQFRWSLAAGGAADAASGEWHESGELACSTPAAAQEELVESAWLPWKSGDATPAAVFCVRYREEAGIWSPWSPASEPASCTLEAPPASTSGSLPTVTLQPQDDTVAQLTWPPFTTANTKAKHLQYRVELRDCCGGDSPAGDEQEADWIVQAIQEHPAATISTSSPLTCLLLNLQPSRTYEVRVRARHFRLEDSYRSEVRHRFEVPSTGLKPHLPGLRQLSDASLSRPLRQDQDTDGILVAFSLTDRIPDRHKDKAWTLEWAPKLPTNEEDYREQGSEWHMLAEVPRHGREVGTHEGGAGRAMVVSLPMGLEAVYVRARCPAGIATSMLRVVPYFDPPSSVTASVHWEAGGLSVLVEVEARGKGCQYASLCQLLLAPVEEGSEAEGGGEKKPIAWRELPLLPLAASPKGVQRASLWLQDEMLSAYLQPHLNYKFKARICDGKRWSDWSEHSTSLVRLAVSSPEPVSGDAIVVEEVSDRRQTTAVRWQRFSLPPELGRVDYRITVQDEAGECMLYVLPAALAEAEDGGTCHTLLQRLVPDSVYSITVSATLSNLQAYCDGELRSLRHTWRTKSIEGEGPPRPVKQVSLPPDKGSGSPWRWDFWLDVDSRITSEVTAGAYELQWRAVGNAEQDGAAPPEGASWTTASFQRPRSNASARTGSTAYWDLIAERDRQPSDGTAGADGQKVIAMPERVQLRARLHDEAHRVGTTPRLWFSRASSYFVTAFAAPPKPKASMQLLQQKPTIIVEFALCALAPEAGATVPAFLKTESSAPEGVVQIPESYGHRFASRYQLSHRLAGDKHTKMEELPSELLAKDLLAAAPEKDGWRTIQARIPLSSPDFSLGDRCVFSVRIGDEFRWSAWSALSKPAQLQRPAIELGTSHAENIKAAVTVHEVSPPRSLRISRSPLRTAWRGEAVEYQVHLLELDNTHGGALEAAKDAAAALLLQGHDLDIDTGSGQIEHTLVVGELEPDTAYELLLMARPCLYGMGFADFEEISRAQFTWPATAVPAGLWAECWSLPQAQVLSVLPGMESSSARLRGRAALLAWHNQEDLDLQGCPSSDDFATGWVIVPYSLMRIQERPCVLAAPVPFVHGCFRWYSRDRRMAGSRSDLCATSFQATDMPSARIVCTPSACTKLLVEAHVEMSDPSHAYSTRAFWRCLRVARTEDADGEVQFTEKGDWYELPPASIQGPEGQPWTKSGRTSAHIGEADELKIGCWYTFSVRIGDHHRRSAWSASSEPILFDLPAPTQLCKASSGGEALLMEATSAKSVRLHWPSLTGGLAKLLEAMKYSSAHGRRKMP